MAIENVDISSLNAPSNSDKSKEEVRLDRPKKVTKGEVTLKKKGAFTKIKNSIIVGDSRNIGSYLVNDVILPAVKETLFDIIRNGAEMLLFDSYSRRRNKRGRIDKDYTKYASYTSSSLDKDKKERERGYSRSSDFDIDDLRFERKDDAEDVILSLRYEIEEYGKVSVAALYDFIGKSSEVPYTANNYGWDASNFDPMVKEYRRDFYLILPQPIRLKKD